MKLRYLLFLMIFFVSMTTSSCAKEDDQQSTQQIKKMAVEFEDEDTYSSPIGEEWDDYDPLNDIKEIQQRLLSMFEPLAGERLGPLAEKMSRSGMGSPLRADVEETIDTYIVTIDLPGYQKEDIQVQLKKNALLIQAELKQASTENKANDDRQIVSRERIQGAAQRIIRLPQPVKEKGVTANFENGVLEVTVLKAEPEKTVQIDIN